MVYLVDVVSAGDQGVESADRLLVIGIGVVQRLFVGPVLGGRAVVDIVIVYVIGGVFACGVPRARGLHFGQSPDRHVSAGAVRSDVFDSKPVFYQ